MDIERRLTAGVTVLSVSGQLDLFSAKDLRQATEELRETGVNRLVIDFSSVTYIDSSGVGALLNIYSLARTGELKIRFANIHGPVAHVIELTKLKDYFPISENLESAFAELGAS
ncbi:MAG: STAS domain-containing protein [Alkalispirochaetaceae bacterium]